MSTFVHRPILMSEAGAVVSGHHKASEAGAAVLRDGGNAMDAAVAASAALCVAIPHMNGLGGDCIALYFEAVSGRVTAINGSGRAPLRTSPEAIRAAGHATMPLRGPWSISVCGLVDAWQTSLDRFGTRQLATLLEPAEMLARAGVPIDLQLEAFLGGPLYAELTTNFPDLATLYGAPGARSLGAKVRNPALAETLAAIARDGARALYDGPIGRALVADLHAVGCPLSVEDLATHSTRFDPPLTVSFAGRHLHTAPPNAQGLALAVMAGLADHGHARTGNLQLPSPRVFLRWKELAFTLRAKMVGDPEIAQRPDGVLTPDSLAHLAQGMHLHEPAPIRRPTGDTSTLVVVDRWGNAVSWVQSLFEEFGSGIVSPSTGIVLHNRLALQGLDRGDPWLLRAGRRPFHTLCPAIVVRNGRCEIAIATPGDHGQPQTIFQVLMNIYAGSQHVQAAIEAPRIRHDAGPEVMIEDRVPNDWAREICSCGYEVRRVGAWSRLMGGVNAIYEDANGLLMAGADPRRASYGMTAD